MKSDRGNDGDPLRPEPGPGRSQSCRPLGVTVADTWSWLQGSAESPDDERASEIGITREREQEIIASVI